MRRAMLAAALLAPLACSDPGPATVTDRLWVSELPTSARKPITAFLITRARGDSYVGAFWQGSVYRGGHDLFSWKSTGEATATVHFFQDDSERRVRFRTCKPQKGFDHCIVLQGDPRGDGRYQSRKRWVVRGRRKPSDLTLTATLGDLAADEPDLQALIELPQDLE